MTVAGFANVMVLVGILTVGYLAGKLVLYIMDQF